MSRHRRRAVTWAAVALVLAAIGLDRTRSAAAPAVPEVQVIEIRRAIAAGERITAADLTVRIVPAPQADPHQVRDRSAAIGKRTAVAMPAGSPLMDAELATAQRPSSSRDFALRLDDLAGVPAENLAGARADLYLIPTGRPATARQVLANVLVVSASHDTDGTVATIRLPASLVPTAIAAEAAGQLRLVAVSDGFAP